MPPRFPPPRQRSVVFDPCPNGPVPIIICGPSGSGKTTIMDRLVSEYSDCMTHSISHTTRVPRDNETDGIDYYFIDVRTMQDWIDEDKFLEFNLFAGNYYGTSRDTVANILRSGKLCILTIDINGCEQFRKYPELNTKYLFIRPPTIRTLESRLRNRGDTSEGDIIKRLNVAVKEIDYSRVPGNFDEIFINDNLDKCYYEIAIYLDPFIHSVRKKAAEERKNAPFVQIEVSED